MEDIRVDLSPMQPGAYAVVRGSVPWGMTRKLMVARDVSEATFADLALTEMVSEWNVRGKGGVPLPLPCEAKGDDLAWLDTAIVMTIARAAGSVVNQVTSAPNGVTASSTS